ncbi:hypothetical protein ACI2L1_12140 [Streptomyces sp. NPDC019531]|uniref:hypothetical protein n=1 Tax=Streptomyces sp. NPDC019531 TaxID=3365062 RepID=UPI00384E7676
MGGLVDQIESELEDLHAHETSPGMAAVAVELAKAIVASDAPTAKAVVADKLRTIMADLRRQAPVESKGDAVDDVAQQREKRRSEASKRASGG